MAAEFNAGSAGRGIWNSLMQNYDLPLARLLMLGLFIGLSAFLRASDVPVPSVDAGLGPCTVDFIAEGRKYQPLYNAQIRVQFKYGLWGMKRMNLQVGTNSDGKARFTGLPTKLRKPPLDFVILYGKAEQHWYWTGLDCHQRFVVVLNTD